MDPKEIIEKVGKKELQAAIASDDPDALKNLLESAGIEIEITDEQMDFIAGGSTHSC